MKRLSSRFMYYAGLIAGSHPKAVEDLKHIQNLIDAEEQGLLIRLPCKVGDIFWELNRLAEPPCCYPRRVITLTHCVYVLNRLGKTVFLTREEAEAALKEMVE